MIKRLVLEDVTVPRQGDCLSPHNPQRWQCWDFGENGEKKYSESITRAERKGVSSPVCQRK